MSRAFSPVTVKDEVTGDELGIEDAGLGRGPEGLGDERPRRFFLCFPGYDGDDPPMIRVTAATLRKLADEAERLSAL